MRVHDMVVKETDPNSSACNGNPEEALDLEMEKLLGGQVNDSSKE